MFNQKITIKPIILFTLLLLVIALTGCGGETAPSAAGTTGAGAAGNATLRLIPSAGEATLEVWIDEVSNFYALDMEIQFDAAKLQVADSDLEKEGVQIQPGQAPAPDFVAENSADNQSGVIHYVITQLAPRDGFSGRGLVATIILQDDFDPAAAVSFGPVTLVNQDGEAIEVALTNIGS